MKLSHLHLGKDNYDSEKDYVFFEDSDLCGESLKIIKKFQEKSQKILDLEKKAYYDNLTGLFNRHGIDKNLEDFNKKEELSIVLLDIDNLKAINTEDYNKGDDTIKNTALIIQNEFGKNKTHKIIARQGGDEFIIISDNPDKKDFIETIKRIDERLKEHNISITSSSTTGIKKNEISENISKLHSDITEKKRNKELNTFQKIHTNRKSRYKKRKK